jgi:hypothetical protein
MKVPEQIALGSKPESAYDRDLQVALSRLLRAIAVKANQLGDGLASGRDNGRTAAPTTGRWQQGDEIFNTAPTELGTSPNKYVIQGWKCVASGTPGTWVQMRFLTGN